MADKRCDNGHFIDESWDICPYCPQDQSEPEIPVVRPRAVEASPARSLAGVPSGVPSGGAAAVAVADQTGSRGGSRSGSSPALAAVQPPMERTVAAAQVNAAKRYVVAWLVALSGASRGESFPVRMGRNVIGRDRRSDIVIHDEQASSHHADLVFRPEEKRFILMDHNSTNGTYVNEAEIEPRRDLAAKDVIRIGAQRFLFAPLCHDGFHWDDEGLLK
ncbi:MAG TPA: FHA domain-containing protein [Thermoanaerobaculia bacterium]|nr:FHA domain-containing protein [Thermoanaerobaculia bacterium]